MKIEHRFVGLVIINVENGSYALAQLVESMDHLSFIYTNSDFSN